MPKEVLSIETTFLYWVRLLIAELITTSHGELCMTEGNAEEKFFVLAEFFTFSCWTYLDKGQSFPFGQTDKRSNSPSL